jgi:hypothetical protein
MRADANGKAAEEPWTARTSSLPRYRVWNRRGYDMNIWSDKKQNEKIDYIHNNPVVRGLVAHPGDWPWSSWRFYCREDRSLLGMDHPR